MTDIPLRSIVIAIDGPSGSGKSSVAKAVATRLGLAFLDTGAMYRAVTWWCLDQGIALDDQPAVAAASTALVLEVGTDPGEPGVRANGIDVARQIRAGEVSTAVSAVATNLAVRAELIRRQRELIDGERRPGSFSGGRGIVAEGRDITTVVAPDADVRLLLTADEQSRLARRARELHGSADPAAVAATRDQVLRRDADDSTVVQFQVAGDGVVTVDSSLLDLAQTIDAVLRVVAQVTGSAVAPETDTAP